MLTVTWVEVGEDLLVLDRQAKAGRLRALIECVRGEPLTAVDFPHLELDGFHYLELRPGLYKGDLVTFAPQFLAAFQAWSATFLQGDARRVGGGECAAEPDVVCVTVPTARASEAKRQIASLVESAPTVFEGYETGGP